MKKAFLLSAAVLLLFSAPLFASPPNMQEGNWEMTMNLKVEGVPFPMPPMKINHCYTKKELEDNKSTMSSGSDKKNDCEIKNMKTAGNSATWDLVCKDGSTGSGEITYKGSTYDSTLKMVTKDGGKTMTTIKAKRLGDCK